jgi:phosphoribosylanthranilate isomerase
VFVRVKICGITNVADAVAAVEAGADALGFMFFEQSKRNISFAAAAEIIRELPPFVSKVGVFVNATQDAVQQAIKQTGIDTLQFHGEESPEFCASFAPLKTIKAFRVRSSDTLKECKRYPGHAWLLDSYVDGALGGTGVTFDWNVAQEAVKLNPYIILAGGLKVDTVTDALWKVRPFAVDVSSGVESAPGKKDHALMSKFIESVHSHTGDVPY